MRTAAILLPVVLSLAWLAPHGHGRASARVVPNDNRAPAGALRDGTLRLRLEARLGEWHPDGDATPGADVPAFAEEGHAPRIPGPLVRVPAGTVVALTLRNGLRDTLRVHGLFDRASRATADDSLVLAPDETRAVRFRLDAPGTYFYWGTTTGRPLGYRLHEDAQLTGAIVVDPAGASARSATHDRVVVLGAWTDTVARVFTERARFLGVMNGRAWPASQRLRFTVGDTVRLRVINASADLHPMHLHGFFFRVASRGDGLRDTLYEPRAQDLVVTEAMVAGQTAVLTWVPDRAGNWLFHCHIPEHFARRGPLGTEPPAAAMHAGMNHALEGMGGLVMGIEVRPRGAATAASRRAAAVTEPRRRVRLLVRANAGGTDAAPFYAFVEQHGSAAPPPDSGRHAGPPLVLVRGEPTSITVVNMLREPTAVHWHGIELESYYDGVAGYSGDAARIAPVIAPGDSFVARMTPPRAGTFIYHTHVDEQRQQRAGLAGPIVVLEPGERYDPATDHAIVLSSPATLPLEARSILVGGRAVPDTLVLRAGVTHRLRFVNMTVRRATLLVELLRDTTHVVWTPRAKDGADLAPSRRVPGPAIYARGVSIGETYDAEVAPDRPGDLRIVVRTGGRLPSLVPVGIVPVRVVQ